MATAPATAASMARPAAGRIWIVTSRATSDCHSLAAERTDMTAPVVSEARKVMMATTATSARREAVACGTSGVAKRGTGTAASVPGASNPRSPRAGIVVSVVDMQAALVQHEPAGVEL